MLLRNMGDQAAKQTAWQDLAEGAPTILGFAGLCSSALMQPNDGCSAEQLTAEAKTILVLAASRGTIDIRANRDSFDSADRFLAVCVEYELEHRLLFLNKENPQQTVRFLEGFRELCQQGLVLHHLQRDFSLSGRGFELAKSLRRDDFSELIQFAVELD